MRTPSSALSAKQTFSPAAVGLSPPPLSRNRWTIDASGLVEMYPSPICAARSMDRGPNPDTYTFGGSSGRVYRRALSSV